MIERSGCWFTEPAIKILEDFFKNFDKTKSPYALETGMGSSTLYLKNKCDLLISIEHDILWLNKIRSQIEPELYKNTKLIFAGRPYNNIINHYPPDFFDLIIIDGRDRVKCTQSAIPKLKSGGWLILDNSEREYYNPGIDLMKEWNRIDCHQNRPDKYDFTYPDWTTSIFIKP